MTQPQKWSTEDIETLKTRCNAGSTYWDTAVALNRSVKAVKDKAYNLGLAVNKRRALEGPAPRETKERPDVTNEEIVRLRRNNEHLTKLLSEERAALKRERRENSIAEEMADIVRAELAPLPLTTWEPKRSSTSTKAAECDAILLFSDQHCDEVVSRSSTFGLEEYDFDIFRCRLQRMISLGIGYSTKWLPAHHFTHGWIFDLGDGLQGDIHGHGPNNYFGNTIKAAVALGHVKAQAIQALLPCYEDGIDYVGVSGNHPRRSIRKDYAHGPHDNFDYVSNVVMATLLQDEKNFRCHLPDSWIAFAEVRGKTWCLNHGDDVKATWGIPWYGFERKNQRVQAQVRNFDEHIDYFAYGHFHTPIAMTSNKATSYHNGAFVYTDPFAINAVSSGNEPLQWMLAADDAFGVVLPIPLWVRDKAQEQRFRTGEWQPDIGQKLPDFSGSKPDSVEFPLIQAPN